MDYEQSNHQTSAHHGVSDQGDRGGRLTGAASPVQPQDGPHTGGHEPGLSGQQAAMHGPQVLTQVHREHVKSVPRAGVHRATVRHRRQRAGWGCGRVGLGEEFTPPTPESGLGVGESGVR